MDVDEKRAAAQSTYKGQTYYFCAQDCQQAFDRNPEKYAANVQVQGGAPAMSKHALLMVACCLIPLGLIGAAYGLGFTLDGVLPIAMVLLCPILHLVMMRGMGHDHAGHSQDQAASVPAEGAGHSEGRAAKGITPPAGRGN
jgi:YHS domain-containing protein